MMSIIIPKEDYYANMYDIENLTHLNRRRKKSKRDILVVEELICKNKCLEAQKILDQLHQTTESEVLKKALWIKNKLFSQITNHKNLSPKSCSLKELKDYLQIPIKNIKEKMVVEKPVEKDWKKIQPNPLSEEEVNNFYKTTDSYIYELMAANHIVQTLYSFYVLKKKIQNLNIKTILDYGAGAGTLCILLKKLGYNVIYADLGGKTFDYAKWRFEQRKLNIPMIDLCNKDITNIDFDCILSTEVIEHLVKPEKLISKFSKLLKTSQILIVSESCEYFEDFSSHLEHNKKLGGKNFIKLLTKHNFKHILKDPFIPQLIFQKE